jgi:cysteine desulfurase
MKLPVYLDNHSTTKVDPRVVEAMLPFFTDEYGNASSRQHEFGWKAEAAVKQARRQVGDLIGAQPEEIVFTSGATESINLALKGAAEALAGKGDHIITAATEHKAVLDTCRRLEKYGFKVTYLPVDRFGTVDPSAVADAINDKTILVSIMMANNEIGTIAPTAEIARVCSDHGVVCHSDASQAVGKVPVDLSALKLDMVSFTAHKMYGPKGIGALFVRRKQPRVNLVQQIDGGGHESGLRSGTLNVPAIVGFGMAARIARQEMPDEARRIHQLRDRLVDGVLSQLDDAWVNGHPTVRLAGNANITFAGVTADSLMMEMKDIAVSSGSACSSAAQEPSHVLRAIGLAHEDVLSSLRFGLGRFTTAEEVECTIGRVVETVKRARERASRFQAVHT